MAQSNKLYKKESSSKIWWVDNGEEVKGEFVFTFDKKTYFNLFADYPDKLTKEQKKVFDEEEPFWAEFFADRN